MSWAQFIVEVVAINKDNYEKVILVQSEHQVHMNDCRLRDAVEGTYHAGMVIDPKDFPEMDRFQIRIRKND